MLIDDITILVQAGKGGDGAVSFRRTGQTAKGGPDGGNGGNGGNVYFQGTNDIEALQQFRYKKSIQAEEGIAGGRQNLFGRNGKDLIVSVPIGTTITDIDSCETWEIQDTKTKVLLTTGGKGGRGNNEFKSSTNQTPRYAEPGEAGQQRTLHLKLRLIADVGLIGLPNAGKSSLLQELTNARPKIGDYNFTTLEPNLGVLQGITIADIPGLIEGASTGRGLGIKFLQHIEKTKLLIHCIDASTDDVVKSYETVRKEFEQYNKELLTKKELILLTKSDLVDEKHLKEKIRQLKKIQGNIHSVSLYDDNQIASIKSLIFEELESK